MCIAAVGLAATRGKRLPHKGNWFVDLLISYLVSITLAGTSIIAPFIFRRLILIQKLEPEWMTNQLLCWRVALRFLSLVTLFVALVLDMQICHNSNAIDLDALDVNFTAPEIIKTKFTKILNQSADRDVESLEGIFDEMEINEKLHLDLFEGDILGRFSALD